jgi:hypothetical protein
MPRGANPGCRTAAGFGDTAATPDLVIEVRITKWHL